MTPGIEGRDERVLARAVREGLDAAVRALAIGSGELGERVGEAGALLGRLSRDEFAHAPDRQLLDRVRHALMRTDLAENFPDRSGGFEVTDEALKAIAADMIELRDRALERAVAEAGAERRASR